MRTWRSANLVSVLLASALGAGCVGGSSTSGSQGASGSSSGTASAGTNSTPGPTTGGASSSGGSGTGSSGSTGSSTGLAASSTGTGTGGRVPDFVDGGYVFCTAEVAIDGGEQEANWMCLPGTYFCASPGSCLQCRSDSDCADATLPTYEPSRPRCDLDSGVSGYQNHCQQCTADSDCTGDGIADKCDLDPTSVEPIVEMQGFETCANLGPGCPYGTQPALNGCASYSCTTDTDCANAVSSGGESLTQGYSSQQAEPYCVSGKCASSPDDNQLCPDCYCLYDISCVDPRATCDLLDDHCACTDSSQCGGAWPICEIPQNADTDDAGDPLGSCGCRRDSDCGDGGLRCLYLPADNALYGGPACLFDCNDPRFPGCANLTAATPLCDVDSGLCGPCETDQECHTQATGLFVGPYCRDDGICGCQVDSDCPYHEVCGGLISQGQAGGMLGQCTVPPLRCTSGSCPQSDYCDLDGGACVPGARVCADDTECVYSGDGTLCETDGGACVQCLADADCVALGWAARGYSYCQAGSCSGTCGADADCVGNPGGAKCVSSGPSSPPFCGCAADPDCAGNPGGSRCSSGTCGCNDTTDCPPGVGCLQTGGTMSCSSWCFADAYCPPGWFCSESDVCRPRCDDGGAGCQAPALVCDSNDIVGSNGSGTSGPVPGAVWCYECVTGDDCPAGQSCSGTACNSALCYGKGACHTGEVCANDAQCHASCDAGACPSGQLCDTGNLAGYGLDLCYQCLSAADCPGGEGCNLGTHTCGTCEGPGAFFPESDCPPDAVCSNYWGGTLTGVCLQNCDVFDCPNPSDICAVFPELTTDHKYCFGCLQDSDCGDAGAHCDTSIGFTFTCQPGP